MTAEPILLDYLRPRDWRQLARAVVLLDLSEDDYFDVHADCTRLWCGPENKPAGWPPELAITVGALRYPRAYVGTITFHWGDAPPDWASGQVYPVALQISITEVRDRRLATAAQMWRDDPEAGRWSMTKHGAGASGSDSSNTPKWRGMTDEQTRRA